jgi:hypothetical protein
MFELIRALLHHAPAHVPQAFEATPGELLMVATWG